MAGQAASEKAERRAARERVATYHEVEQHRLVARLRDGLSRLDAGDIDVFEFDDIVHRYKNATQKLWTFCVGGSSDKRGVARLIEADEVGDWWEAAGSRRR